MARKPMPIEQVMELLAGTPGRFVEMTEGLDPEQLRTAPEHDEWSVVDVLAHLRACADTWGGCIATILAEDHPTIRAVDPRTWMKETDYPDLEFQPSFHAFTAQRDGLLEVLNPLTPEQWGRGATVIGAGKPLERTVHFYAGWLARHERSHYRQIARIAEAMRGCS